MGATRCRRALWPRAKEILEKLQFIEEMTTKVDAVQERLLAKILSRNSESEYLLKHGLAGATDRAAFRSKVPMVTYEDLKPYIMRIANGEKSPVLTGSGHPISELFVSSGTSGGEPKLIPSVKDDFDRRQLMLNLSAMPVMKNQLFAADGLGNGSGLYFFFVRSDAKTPSGMPVRTIQTSYYKSDHFKSDHGTYLACTSPMAAVHCEDSFQSMYAQMVCGLCQRHGVVRVGAVFATGLVRSMHFLQQHWEQLAADIEAGELSPGCVPDPSVRAAVAAILRPDPELAELIRAECAKSDWAGIIRRIWSNAKYLETIATGSMAQYVPTLDYYSGGLPIASTKYVSSEGTFGLNLKPMCDPSEVSYTIMLNMAYFEFLPVDAATADDDARASELVELAGVEVGREYELVVTTYAGLYRYRVGDVLRVTGFHNAAPQFRFVGRNKVLLSIDVDKTEEGELQRAVERASSALLHPRGAAVLDYTSRTCTERVPGHYIVYWELWLRPATATDGGSRQAATAVTESVVDGGDVLDRCCLEMEESLSYVYRMLRVKDRLIGPLEIRIVQPGTFQELANYTMSHGGASMGQYKVPRCVSAPSVVRLLDSRVVSCHFSPALPQWAPDHSFELEKNECRRAYV